jgi:heat shock protein HslJ
MDTNPNDVDPDDFNFDGTNSGDTNPNPNSAETNTSKRSTNYAITIVIVAGIILGAILLANRPPEDATPVTPGAGNPIAIQPMATPPTPQINPTQPVQDRPTHLPPTQMHPPTSSVPASPIQGIHWQWVNVTDSSTGQVTTVSTPAQYTIVFTPEGFVNGNADCNSFTGTYSQTNGLAIRITTMTIAACPAGSLEQQYIQLLGTVAAGGPDGTGNLALETAGGAQRMLFQNGGPAK